MTDAIFGIRQDVLKRRLSGGNSILWSAKDAARIRQHVFELSEKNLLRVAEVKLLDSQRPVAASSNVMVLRAMDTTALSWQFQITNEAPDLCFDVIKCAGWNLQNFRKNGPVLDCHNSAIPPLGQSSMPWPSGSGLTANVTFPEPGTSAASDQVRAMVAAGVLRGASVGFIPGKFKFSSDPARPLGIDFMEGHILTESSICSVPCQPVCLVVGPAAGSKSARRRNVPVDDVTSEDGSNWQCHADHTMPIDASDDAYDPTAAKAALLARFSPAGTITDEARDYFFAVDVSAPFAASSYKFPFCRAADGGIVASKIGWRQSFAALEKSNMSGIVISEARSLVDHLEARLGEVKTAARRREARLFAAKVRSVSESIQSDHCPNPRTAPRRGSEFQAPGGPIVKSFARSSSAQKGPVAGVPKNSNRAAAVSSRAAESGNLCGPGSRPGPHLRDIQAIFDSDNPSRSGSLAGESYASVLENHPRYPTLRSVRDAKLLARLDRVVEQKIKRVGLLQQFGFDEAGITLYHAAALSAFRAALPTN